MFFIIDIVPGMKLIKQLKGNCQTCQTEGSIELIKTYTALRLFFIPIIKWHTRYYLRHSCGGQVEVSEEIALGIQYEKIPIDQFHISHEAKKERRCTACHQLLESNFEYCPYCGKHYS